MTAGCSFFNTNPPHTARYKPIRRGVLRLAKVPLAPAPGVTICVRARGRCLLSDSARAFAVLACFSL